ncbi:MAG: DUF3419 family protein [Chitinophagaceae bacterium]
MLYYSHVNEDNRVERKLLQKTGNTTIVAVAGSGERVIALMDIETCKQVHIVDVNEEALLLLQLKLAALEELTVEEYLQFCGHYAATHKIRSHWFDQLKNKLTSSCKMYWESNLSGVEKGILYTGHFEKFLQRMRPSVNFFLGKNFLVAFSGNPIMLKKFPKAKWKLLSRLFSLRWIYKLWGNKDAAFVSKDAVTAHIPSALNEVIYKGEAGSCFMAHLIFKGHLREMKEDDLPPSLQKEVLLKIKNKLISSDITIRYHHTDILDFVNKKITAFNKPVFYSVSDILSFENLHYLQQLIDKTTSPGNYLVWRAFLRNRANTGVNTLLASKPGELQEHTTDESTRMYQVFSIQKALS